MKAFISYSRHDVAFAGELAKYLELAGMDAFFAYRDLAIGENWVEAIESALAEADVVFVVLSSVSAQSDYVLGEIAKARVWDKYIVPVLTDDTRVPSSLADVQWLDLRPSNPEGWATLDLTLRAWQLAGSLESAAPADRTATWDVDLSTAFDDGELTLFLGAGVSASAGVPDWGGLLGSMLEEIFTGDGRITPGTIRAAQAVDLFRDRFGGSPLIVARYLKNTYRNEFIPRVRDDLYKARDQRASALVDAVVDLCRPRRGGRALRSIVTFNFDDLIERSLAAQHVDHYPIHAEGQRPPPEALPIYHVHGYLPSEGEIPDDHGVVLSEDAYHTQFADAFNWSNLVQLIELTQSTCLLVGLSVSDPNLRRLLDIAARKSSDRASPHYLIKLRPGAMGLSSTDEEEAELMPLIQPKVEILEEADANSLGLNVIWVDDYGEIPGVLERIGA